MHALPAHIGPGLFPELQGLRVVAKLDADFFENDIGIVFDQRQTFLVQNLVGPDLAGDVRHGGTGTAAAARCPAGRSPPPLAALAAACARFCRDIVHVCFLARALDRAASLPHYANPIRL